MAWLLLRLLWLQLATFVVDVDDDRLTVVEQLAGFRARVWVSRLEIIGFWVRSGVDENGPTGDFELMTDTRGFQSRVLIGGVRELEPLVTLTEKLGAR